MLITIFVQQATDTDDDTLEDIVRNTAYGVLEGAVESETGGIVNCRVASTGRSSMLFVVGFDCAAADYRCLDISQYMCILDD
jgi:hypothetical protein